MSRERGKSRIMKRELVHCISLNLYFLHLSSLIASIVKKYKSGYLLSMHSSFVPKIEAKKNPTSLTKIEHVENLCIGSASSEQHREGAHSSAQTTRSFFNSTLAKQHQDLVLHSLLALSLQFVLDQGQGLGEPLHKFAG